MNQRNYVNQVKKRAQTQMWEQIGTDLKEDVQGTKKLLYSMAKAYKNRNDDKSKNTSLKNKAGEIITGQSNILDRWIEYFKELLNVEGEPDTRTQPEQPDLLVDLETTEDQITMAELEAAINSTRNNKAPGPDIIPI